MGLIESLGMVFVLTYTSLWLGLMLFQRLAPDLFSSIARRSAWSSRLLLYGPAIVACIVSAAVLLPGLTVPVFGAPDHCLVHEGGHHHHLCLFHPPHAAWSLTSLVPLLVFLLVFVGQLTRFLVRLRRDDRMVRTLRATSRAAERWSDVRLLDQREPIALTVGRRKPVILLSTGLIERTSDETLSTILAHERAHIARRDNWRSLADRLMAAFWPSPFSEAVLDTLSTFREKSCDEAAAEDVGSRAAVAHALLEVLKLQLAPSRLGMSLAGSAVEERIEHLLSPPPGHLRVELVLAVVILTTPFVAHLKLHVVAEHLVTFLNH